MPARSSIVLLTLMLLPLVGCGGGAESEPVSNGRDVPATSPPAVPPASGSVGASPARFDLGAIEPGSEHARTFQITNGTGAPVRFVRAVPSCKCTTVTEIADRTLAPGESLPFEAVLAAPRTPGVKEAKIQVLYEGGPPLQLVIAGDVTMPIKATPAFIGGPKGKTSAGTVVIESVDGRPFTILQAGGAPPLAAGPSGDASSARHELEWDLARLDDLSRNIWWTVFTDHPDCPVLPLRIRSPETGSRSDMARFDRHWMFDERVVNAERLQPGETALVEVVLAHYNPRQRGQVSKPQWRNLRSISSLSPNATAEMVAVTPISRDEIRVSFSFTPVPDFSGPLDALIRIETETGSGECTVLALVD